MSIDPFTISVDPLVQEQCFLVVVDKSEEMSKALRFASRRAKSVGGRVALLGIITPNNFAHWVSVGELMKEEAREQIEALLAEASERAEAWSGQPPVTYVREGEPVEVINRLLREEEQLKLLVLAADARGSSGPGPLVSAFSSRSFANCRVPITLVPGNLTDDQIDAIA